MTMGCPVLINCWPGKGPQVSGTYRNHGLGWSAIRAQERRVPGWWGTEPD